MWCTHAWSIAVGLVDRTVLLCIALADVVRAGVHASHLREPVAARGCMVWGFDRFGFSCTDASRLQ